MIKVRKKIEHHRPAFRSLHMKLVLILVLLIVSVMAVVGTFLFNRVSAHYYNDFTEQMNAVFNANMFTTLQSEAVGDEGAARIKNAIEANYTALGINTYRNFYILDGATGKRLEGTSDEELERTHAIIVALDGKIGQETSIAKPYLDRAVPVLVNGDVRYIVYIKDTKQEIQSLTASLFTIILQAMLFGLVIAIFLSFLLSKTITTPIENLTHGAQLMGQGQFQTKLEVHSDDEIGILTQTFNDMSQILKDTLETVEGERNKLNTLFLHMTDGVAAFSRDGRVMQLNPAAREMLGILPDEFGSFKDIFHDVEITFDQALALNQPDSIECNYFIDGRTLKIYFAAFGTDEGEGGVIAVIHDITEQFKLETARREFVANVSHELRTPLTNVKSYTETLLDMTEEQDETQKRFYGVILNETDRMTRIVKDLLILSRLDYAKMDWKMTTFSIKKSIENVYHAMEIDARNHKHTMELRLTSELPEIYGDRERIEQVLVNVISNAIKYTMDGGKIIVDAKCDGKQVYIAVSDNGIGVPEEDINRIFDRFYRVDKARSRERGGTGLGLAIAKEIVEYHGGSIQIDSKLDIGTTVTVTLACMTSDEV